MFVRTKPSDKCQVAVLDWDSPESGAPHFNHVF